MIIYPTIFSGIYIPDDYNIPPTLYSIMNSLANFENDDPVKIKDLALSTHSKIFDFNYPLASVVNKEEFECQILNHFIMRRIGYETMTSFKLALNVKLNEIMPMYNKLFDAINSWNIFDDGETTTRELQDNRTSSEINSVNNSMLNTISANNISDRRNSELPQNEINDVKDGSYLTDYNYDTDVSSSNSNTSSNSNSNTNNNEESNIKETISKIKSRNMEDYKIFLENKQNIMTMIYKDLDVLFYGLV